MARRRAANYSSSDESNKNKKSRKVIIKQKLSKTTQSDNESDSDVSSIIPNSPGLRDKNVSQLSVSPNPPDRRDINVSQSPIMPNPQNLTDKNSSQPQVNKISTVLNLSILNDINDMGILEGTLVSHKSELLILVFFPFICIIFFICIIKRFLKKLLLIIVLE